MLNMIIEIINSNAIVMFLCTICTIISIPISIFLYFRDMGVKRLKYISKWYIFDKENDILPDGLYVPKNLLDKAPLYYAKIQAPPVHTRNGIIFPPDYDDGHGDIPWMCDRSDNICIAKFVFWNSGRYCIDSKDVISEKKLHIYNQKNVIISASIIAQEEVTNHISAKCIDKHTVEISFDYIDRNEGAVLAVAYTGLARYSIDEFHFAGKVKGGLKIKRITNTEDTSLNRIRMNNFHEVNVPKKINLCSILFWGLISCIVLKAITSELIHCILSGDVPNFVEIFFAALFLTFSILILLNNINNSSGPTRIMKKFNSNS